MTTATHATLYKDQYGLAISLSPVAVVAARTLPRTEWAKPVTCAAGYRFFSGQYDGIEGPIVIDGVPYASTESSDMIEALIAQGVIRDA